MVERKKLKKNKRYNIKKHIPSRQCISCRSQVERDNFIRVIKVTGLLQDGEKLVVNPSKHEFGRSAYICKLESCITKAVKEKKLAKMLRASIKSVEQIMPTFTSLITGEDKPRSDSKKEVVTA